MSRGISKFQQKVLSEIEECGLVDTLRLRELNATPASEVPLEVRMIRRSIWESDRTHADGDCRCANRRECHQNNPIRVGNSLYRAMRSLERRGLVFRIDVHPTVWTLAIERDGKPYFDWPRLADNMTTQQVLRILGKRFTFRALGKRWERLPNK